MVQEFNTNCLAIYQNGTDSSKYTVLKQVLLGAGNLGNHQNFDPSLLSYNNWLIFIGMKDGRFKKMSFSTPPILNMFLQKF